ncbi:MAG: phenylacetate--CoA ligase family protein, partial [Verrucomicrobiales bacterium]
MPDPLAQLNELLATILPRNPFYQAKLRNTAGPFSSLDEFTAAVPFTTKDELAADHEAHPPYGTTHTFPLANYHRYHQT